MNKTEEIKKRAKKIRGSGMSIQSTVEEKEICKELDRILETRCIDEKEDEKILNHIELYLLLKQKLENNEENYNYLQDMAEDLRNQKIRSDDLNGGFPLFKVAYESKIKYFLTRTKAQEFLKTHHLENLEIIEIEKSEDEKIKQLIETIKENY